MSDKSTFFIQKKLNLCDVIVAPRSSAHKHTKNVHTQFQMQL